MGQIIQKMLIIIIFISISVQNSNAENVLPRSFCRHTYSGFIGDMQVQMDIKIRGDTIEGSYRYNKYNKDIMLRGKVQSDGSFTIDEFVTYQNLTGRFRGRFLTSESITGEWADAEGKRTLLFSAKRQRVIKREAVSNSGHAFRVISEPKGSEKSLIKIAIDREEELPIYEEAYFVELDVDTLQVRKLSGSPNLWLIEWDLINPDGLGGYRANYYEVVATGNVQRILLRGYVSSGHAGWCNGGIGKYTVDYKDNIITVTEHDNYTYCTSRSDDKKDLITTGESKIIRSYKVDCDTMALIKAEKHERSVKGEELMALDDILQTQKWKIVHITNEEAIKEYPAIVKKDWE